MTNVIRVTTRAILSAFLVVMLAAVECAGQQLKGRLFHYGADGQKVFLTAGVRIKLIDTGNATVTDDSGVFLLPLNIDFREGDDITLEVTSARWVIVQRPWRIPRKLAGVHEIEVLPPGHRRLLDPVALNRFLEGVGRQVSRAPATSVPNQRDLLELALREWAVARGFGLEEVRKALDEWAAETLRTSMDAEARGRALLAQGRLSEAAEAFRDSSGVLSRRRQDLVAKRESLAKELVDLTIRELRVRLQEGTAYYIQERYRDALDTYARALEMDVRQQLPLEWAEVQARIGDAEAAWAYTSNASEADGHAARSLQAYRAALEIMQEDSHPESWAILQNKIGGVFVGQLQRAHGEVARRLGDEAVAAHRRALTVFTHDAFPDDWAMTHGSLGIALAAQAEVAEPEQRIRLLAESVSAFRTGIDTATRVAGIAGRLQINLCNALSLQGQWASGDERNQRLASAVDVCREAVKSLTHDKQPDSWALAQYNLSGALMRLARFGPPEASQAIAAEAVVAARQALEFFSRDRSPQHWADVQFAIGLSLMEQAKTADNAVARDTVWAARAAFTSSLEVRTRDVRPDLWIRAQTSLTESTATLANLTPGDEGLRLSAEAEAAFRDILQYYASERDPWASATTQFNLGLTLANRASKLAGEERVRLLDTAIAATREALAVGGEHLAPADAARMHNALGNMFRAWALIRSGDGACQWFEQAAAAYRTALGLYMKVGTQRDQGHTQFLLDRIRQEQAESC